MAFNAGAAIGKVILDTSQYLKGAAGVVDSNKKMSSNMAGFGGILSQVGKIAAKAFIDSAKAADDFQKKVANVATLVDTAKVDVGAMATGLLSLSGELGSAKDLTGALYQALSASVEPAKAVQFVADSAKFAGAALISTEKSVDLLTTSVNAYGTENLSAAEASDKLFSIIKLGKTDGAQLSAVIGKSIPLAANMGVSFDELGASIAIMTRQGVKSTEATTQFNSTLTAFLKPSTDMTAALKEIGFESGSAAVEQLGFKGAMDAVLATTDGSTDATAKLFRNTRALRGVMALTGDAAKDYDNVLNEITNSAGATQIAFDKQEKTFETLKNQMGKIQIIMGGVAKSFIDELAVGATKAADGMIRFLLAGQGAEILTSIVSGVVAVFEAVKVAMKPLVDILLPSIMDLWHNLAGNLNRLLSPAGDVAGGFRLIAGVIQIGVSIIKVFVVGVKTLITTLVDLVIVIRESGGIFDKFFKALEGKASFLDVQKQIKNTGKAFETLAKNAKEGITLTFDTVKDEINSFNEATTAAAQNVEIAWTTSFNNAKEGSMADFQEIITGWGVLTQKIEEGAEEQAGAIKALGEVSRLANGQILNENLQSFQSSQIAFRALTVEQIALIDQVVGESSAAADTQIENNKRVKDSFIASYTDMAGIILPIFSDVAEAIVTGESAWDAFKKAGLTAIAGVVKAFGEQWLLLSAVSFVPGPTFNVAAGIGYGAAAAAAFTAAGAIQGLASFEDGGRASPGMAMVGEAGPELVRFNQGANVTPNNELNNMGAKITMNNTFIVNNDLDSERISQQLGRQVQAALRG